MERRSEGARLMSAIEAATNCTDRHPDARRLKSIKNLVRFSDDNVHIAARCLMEKMRKNHSQVRLMAAIIADELFTRSKLFRSLWVEDLDKFLSLGVGFRKENPLPAPSDRATLLRSSTLQFLQTWSLKFGHHYRKLRLGYHYLKDVLRIQFPSPEVDADSVRESERARQERAARTQEILRSKYETLVREFDTVKSDIQSTISQVNECFEILSRENEEFEVDEDSYYEFGSSVLRNIREAAMKPSESKENMAVFDAMRELYRLLMTRHLPSVQEWLLLVMKVDLEDNQLSSLTRELIDLRNEMQNIKSRCEELGCHSNRILENNALDQDEDDDIEWEEGAIDASELDILKSDSDVMLSDSNGFALRNADKKGECSNVLNCDPLKNILLQEAPLVPWGSDLDAWEINGSSAPTLANNRGLDIENHWGRVDPDAVVPREIAAELRLRPTVYKAERSEIRPCNARLPNGKLCQRRDIKICPFHGPIVERDTNGNPIQKPQDKKSGIEKGKSLVDDSNLDAEMCRNFASSEESIRAIAAKAIENVRSRDEEAMKRKQENQKASKRSKLLRVREHNESVLRASGLGSSRQGLSDVVGEDLEGWDGSTSSKGAKKKQTLSAMLKKKSSTKDRISQKLLTSKINDATLKQLQGDEDRNYKESFANQW